MTLKEADDLLTEYRKFQNMLEMLEAPDRLLHTIRLEYNNGYTNITHHTFPQLWKQITEEIMLTKEDIKLQMRKIEDAFEEEDK